VLNAGPQTELLSPDFAATRGSRFNFSLPSASEEASAQKNSNNHFM